MKWSKALSVLIACCALVAGGPSVAFARQGGPKPQVPPTGGTSAAAAATANDPQVDLKALVNSPEARSVAVYRCIASDARCALRTEDAATIRAHFDDTLLTGTGTDTVLIERLRALLTSKGGDLWPANVDYAIVHLVTFAEDGRSNRGRWLLFRRHKGRVTASSGRRILGSKRVAVVFLHLGAVFSPGQTLQTLYANVEYRAIAKSKLPINIQNLLGLLRIAAGEAQAGVKPSSDSVLGFGLYTDMPVPSDLTVFGARIDDVPSGFGLPITYDNEGKYIWDASVAVPINKITLLEYEETDGTFTPKTINKQSIYGAIDVYPFPVDLKEGVLRWFVPRAMVGIGMTGRPGENFLLAGAFGIKEFQIFIGSGFANQRVLKPGTDPANGANYTQRYASRLTYGINVPVVSALKKLGGS